MSVYIDEWDSEEDLLRDFEISKADLEGVEILLASYSYYGYEGDSYVLFRKDGKLYENHASHCSCYGLENQWEPEETYKESILHRVENGTWFRGRELKDILIKTLEGIE